MQSSKWLKFIVFGIFFLNVGAIANAFLEANSSNQFLVFQTPGEFSEFVMRNSVGESSTVSGKFAFNRGGQVVFYPKTAPSWGAYTTSKKITAESDFKTIIENLAIQKPEKYLTIDAIGENESGKIQLDIQEEQERNLLQFVRGDSDPIP